MTSETRKARAVSCKRVLCGQFRQIVHRETVGKCVFLCAAVLVTVLFAVPSAWATTSYVDGISDQHLYNWESGISNLFGNAWVGSPPSHIKLVRYVVQWNVMSGGGYASEYTNFKAWYERAGQLGLTREVALADYVGANEPSSSEYKTELENLLNEFTGIRYVEAWNEPNHKSTAVKFYVEPAAAAHYMNAAYSVCQTHNCTAIAGDFLDESNMSEYEAKYISGTNLNPKDPPNWGMHPYAAVDTRQTSTVEAFRNGLPGKGSEHIWFTEVGAYYCKKGESVSPGENASREAYQAAGASYLVNTLIPHTTNLEHVFYYEFAFEGTKRINCGNVEDTELYAPPSEGQPNQPRSAASIIFGPEGPPAASTGSGSGVTPTQATLNGSVNPEGLDDTKYYFQYGTTTEYKSGSTTPGDAGQSLNWESEHSSIANLAPGTLYHYRVVATNAAGTGYGNDAMFTTPSMPEASTSAASGVQEGQATLNGNVNPKGFDGYSATYHFEYGTSSSYGLSTPEYNAGSGTTSIPETFILAELESGMTYHYRIVASNAWGTSYGNDQTFTTPSAPSLTVDQSNDRWGATEGANHSLDVYVQWQSTGEWAGPDAIGGSGTTYSAPSMAIDHDNDRWIAVEGPNHTLDVYVQWQSTGEWSGPQQIGGPGTTYSAPSLTIDSGNNRWISVEGSNHTLDVYVQWQSTGEWAGPDAVGGSGTTYSAPSMAIDHDNDRWISVEGSNHALDVYVQWQSTGEWAGPDAVGSSGTTYSAPSLTIDSGNNRWISVEGSNHTLDVYVQWQSTGEWAGPDAVGGSGTTYSAPSMAIDHDNDRWVSVDGSSNELDVYVQWQSTGEWAGPDAVGSSGTTYSAPSIAIDTLNDRWMFAEGSSNSLDVYVQWQSTGEWAGPEAIGGSGTSW